MRITILANRDLPSNYALNMLLSKLDGHKLTLFLSEKVGKGSQKPAALEHLDFFEQSLLLRNRSLLNFEELASQYGCEAATLNTINSGIGFQRFKNSQPDLVVSIRYGVILQDPVISVPGYGVINLHSGVLPDYKGVMATFRAMLHEEKLIGTTLHYIKDSTIDQGPVIGTTQFPVDTRKSYLWHVLQLYSEGCRLIARTVDSIEREGRVDATAQTTGGHYYTFPAESDLRSFEAQGYKLFDGDEIIELVDQYSDNSN